MFTDEELEILQLLIDDSDWDISERNDVYELLPKLKAAAMELDTLKAVIPCGHQARYIYPPDGNEGTTRFCVMCAYNDLVNEKNGKTRTVQVACPSCLEMFDIEV